MRTAARVFLTGLLWAALLHGGNVILMIGDGLGLAQRNAARIYKVGPGGRLAMDALPYTGWVRTYSANSLITDSAAGATAFATGHKTDNGVIAMTPDKTALKTILEQAEEAGYRTGLVTTTRITHATPAAFAAHVPSRRMEDEIAAQMIEKGIEVLLGGGLRHFTPKGRKDGKDLLARAKALGYRVITTRKELLEHRKGKVLGLFSESHIPWVGQRSKEIPSLAEMTRKALELLSSDGERGFFLMVEGGRIDHGAHAHDPKKTVLETLDFDEAVEVALRFVQNHPNTLLLVVADHETGGMALTGPYGTFPKPGELPEVNWAAKGHTALDVPISAIGYKAERVHGVLENTALYAIMRDALELP